MQIKFIDDFIEARWPGYSDLITPYVEKAMYVLIGIICIVLLTQLSFSTGTGIFSKAENTILDLMAEVRSQHKFTPSEDIVFVSMDQETMTYGRENTELGMANKRVLPRKYVGQIIEYLHDQGAKALIFDVEFKGSQGDENDIPLANAIKKMPEDRIFLGARIDYRLSTQITELKKDLRNNYRYLYTNIIYPQLIVPQERMNYVFNRVGHHDLGKIAPAVFLNQSFVSSAYNATLHPRLNNYSTFPYNSNSDTTDITRPEAGDQSFRILDLDTPSTLALSAPFARHYAASKFPNYDHTQLKDEIGAFILNHYYQKHRCLRNNYRVMYNKDQDYLALLRKNGVNIHFPVEPDPALEAFHSYCWVETIDNTLRESGFKIGITSVEYDEDQYDRKFPILYKLYDESYYLYLGNRAAMSLLQPKKMSFTPNTFQIDDRKIPLVDNNFAFINWRLPHKMVDNIWIGGRANITFQGWLLFPNARLNAGLPAELRMNLLPYGDHAFLPRLSEGMYHPESLLRPWEEMNTPWSNSGLTARNIYAASAAPKRLTNMYREVYKAPQNPVLNMRVTKKTLAQDARRLIQGHLYRRISVSEVLRQMGIKGEHAIAQEKQGSADPQLYRLHKLPESGAFSFKDKIVIYGDSMSDVHRAPLRPPYQVIFGPEVVATVTDMMLHDTNFIQFTPDWLTAALVLITCGIIGFFSFKAEELTMGISVGVLLALLYCAGCAMVFVEWGIYTPFLLPLLLMITTLTGSTIYKYVVLDKSKRALTNEFGKFVSPQVMDLIKDNPAEAMDALRGGKKELTVLFSDLKGFTSTFEDEDPQKMVDQLNEYFNEMTEIILKNNGTYDKYMGDAIMAFFGAPVDVEDHAFWAVKASVEMCDALIELNKKWKKEGRPELGLGVGLSTGLMFVGNFGSERVKNFTVMGSAVNLGARLEAYTRQAGMDIVISEETNRQCGNMILSTDLGQINVKGFSEPVQVYGVSDLSEEAKMAYYEGYSDYYLSTY